MGSRYIEVFRSSLSEMRSFFSRSLPPRRDRDERPRDYDRDYGRYSGAGASTVDYRPHYPRAQDDSGCLRMLGIPFSATETDITRFFQEAGVTPVRIHRKHNGGEAYVEFAYPFESQRALTLNKRHLGHRYIDLIPVTYDEIADVVGLPRRRDLAYFPPPRDYYNMLPSAAPVVPPVPVVPQPYTVLPPVPQDNFAYTRATAPPGCCVKLQGLPYRATRQDIIDFFRGYDFVETSVEMGLDRSGRPSGEALVVVRSPEVALAVKRDKDNTFLGDRYVKIFVD